MSLNFTVYWEIHTSPNSKQGIHWTWRDILSPTTFNSTSLTSSDLPTHRSWSLVQVNCRTLPSQEKTSSSASDLRREVVLYVNKSSTGAIKTRGMLIMVNLALITGSLEKHKSTIMNIVIKFLHFLNSRYIEPIYYKTRRWVFKWTEILICLRNWN